MNKKEYLIKKIKQAIYDFEMIEPNETILVGVSLGKDSVFLSFMLSEIKKTLKNKFNLVGVYLDSDKIQKDGEIDFQNFKKYFENKLNFPLEKIEIKLPKDSKLNDGIGSNCQRCSYARRITLMKLCQQYKATKIAFGHHMDDIVTTAFMNMTSGRNLKIMPPINRMKTGNLTFIRPLSYLREKDILKFMLDNEIPFSKVKCLIGENRNRNLIKKQIVWENEKIVKNFTENIFFALLKDFQEKFKDKDYFT